jgi:hypothetical protein
MKTLYFKMKVLSLFVFITSMAYAQIKTRISEDFNTSLTPIGWNLSLNGGTLLSRATTVQSFGRTGVLAAVKADNFNVNVGNRAQLETPIFSPTVANDSVRFDVAHRAYNAATINDSLIIWAFNGTSYTRVKAWAGKSAIDNDITTAVAATTAFTPTTAQWRTKTVELPVGTTRVRFEFYSNFANNIYIDRVIVDTFYSVTQTYSSSTTTQTNTTKLYAGNGNQQIIGIQVAVNGNTAQLPLTSFLLNTGATTNVADISSARLFNGGTNPVFDTSILFGTAASPNGAFTINGNANLYDGTNYFWLTYNVSPTATSNNILDAICTQFTLNANTVVPTVQNPTGDRLISPTDQIYIVSTLGTASAFYPNLKSALTKINDGTHQGAISVFINESSIETSATTCFIDSSGSTGGANYTSILIRPADTATVVKQISTGISGIVLIELRGADNVTIDGRPGGIGTNQMLTLAHTNPNASATSGSIRLLNGASNCKFTFLNSKLLTDITAVSSINISLSTSAATTGNNNVLIENCTLTGGVVGISAVGTAANFMDNITIRRCTIIDALNSAITTSNVKTINIDSNTIYHSTITSGWNITVFNFNPNISGAIYNITKNNIHSIQTFSAAAIIGINIAPTVAGAVVPVVNVINNHVSLVNTNAGITNCRCLVFAGTTIATNVSCHNNTFRIGGNGTGTAGNPATIGINKSNSSAASTFNCTNNISINTRTGAAGYHVGLFNSTPTSGTNISDYNLFYGPVAPAALLTTLYFTLAGFKTAAAPNDQNSIFGNLDFSNNTIPDLRPLAPNNSPAKIIGTPSIATTDIYGTARNGSTPFKGCFEGSISNLTTNDLGATIIYSYGKIPVGTDEEMRIRVKNNGNAVVNNATFTATIFGANNTTFSTTIPSILVDADTIISLPTYSPNNLGIDSIKINVPFGDQASENDTAIWVRENTLNALSYTKPFMDQSGAVGFNAAFGEAVAKFSTPVPNFINQLNVNFTNAGLPFQVVIYPDSGGNNGPSFNPIYVSATQTTVNGVYNLSLPSVPVSGTFYLGVRQTSTSNFGFAYQSETPIRNQNFYFRSSTASVQAFSLLAWNDFAVNPANAFRFMIEPRLKINNDLGVINVTSQACLTTNASQAVRVTVQNLGLLTQDLATNNLSVYGNIKNPGGVVTNFGPIVINSGVLNSDDTLSVLLSSTYNMSAPGNYIINAWTQFSLDNNPINDSLINSTVSPSQLFTAPYTQSFNAAVTLPTEMTSTRFAVSAGNGVAGSNSLRVNLFNTVGDPTTSNAIITSPLINNISPASVLRFSYKITSFANAQAVTLGNLDSIKIYVSPDCGANYFLVNTIVGNSHIASLNFANIDIPLNAYANQSIRVKIQCDWLGTSNDAFLDIDDIRILDISDDITIMSASQSCISLLMGVNNSVSPQALLKNTGATNLPQTNVTVAITGPANFTGTGIFSASNIGDTATVFFSPSFNPTIAGTYTVKIYSLLNTDSDHLNDTIQYTFNVVNATQTNAGNALNFSGTAFGQIANSPSININTNAITIEAWIIRDAAGTGNRVILSKDSSLVSGQYALSINTGNNLFFTVNTSAGSNGILSTNIIPAGVYTHVAAIYDGTTMRVYINGNLEGTTSHTGNIMPNNGPLNIGRNFATATNFIGRMDEIKIWNLSIAEHEIRQNMHTRLANAPNPNLIGYYRMDEGSGNSVVDASGNCNAMAFAATPVWSTATYPLSSTTIVAMQQIMTDATYPFTSANIDLAYTGVTGSDSVYIHKFSGAPIGTSPITSPGGITAIHNNYWIAYKYGTGAFTSVSFNPTFGGGNLNSGVNVADLTLFGRDNGSNGVWTIITSPASTVDFSSQSATFVNSTTGMFGKQLVVGANNNPLPVKLLYFTAKNNSSNVDLRWATASETNNAGFYIQRSVDGRNFKEIAFVNGNKNSSQQSIYNQVDLDAFAKAGSKKLYYRLVQTDFSGKQEISNVVMVSANRADGNSVAVYPNPFTNEVNINIDAIVTTSAKVSVVDITGKRVLELNQTVNQGMSTIQTEGLNMLSKGIYFVQVTVNGEVTTHKMVKQ